MHGVCTQLDTKEHNHMSNAKYSSISLIPIILFNTHLSIYFILGQPNYSYSPAEDLPPPPPPSSGGGAYHMPADDFLPPPPPELINPGPSSSEPLPPPPPLNPYNEPRPPVQAYKQQPSYQQKPAMAAPLKMNGASKPAPKPAPPTQEYYVPKPSNQPVAAPLKTGAEAEIDALTSLLVQNMDSGLGPVEEGEFFGEYEVLKHRQVSVCFTTFVIVY